jgi:hypothetical protein
MLAAINLRQPTLVEYMLCMPLQSCYLRVKDYTLQKFSSAGLQLQSRATLDARRKSDGNTGSGNAEQ